MLYLKEGNKEYNYTNLCIQICFESIFYSKVSFLKPILYSGKNTQNSTKKSSNYRFTDQGNFLFFQFIDQAGMIAEA